MTGEETGVRGSLSDGCERNVEGQKEENMHWLRNGRISSGRNAERMPKGTPSVVMNIYP